MQLIYLVVTFILGLTLGSLGGIWFITRVRNSDHKNLAYEFENLATRILAEKNLKLGEQSQKINEQNYVALAQILTPLKERIKDFEAKVNVVYHNDGKDRAGLREQISNLYSLNKQITSETKNLTQALKGDNKLQGNWGEMILENILHKSGLIRGVDYLTQETLVDETGGKRYRPDVIINLPEGKHLVIDSKVSLVGYERAVNAEANSLEQSVAIKEHIRSFREHIKNLSNKNYQKLYQIKSVDFVLMFIPIEAAFNLAMQHDNELFDYGLKCNVMFVCSSTLFATMRTVYMVWQHEKSMQNTNEIAKIGGELYDRFVGFIAETQKLEAALQNSQKIFTQTMQKLQGRVGVFKSVQKLKDLGAKTTKNFPQQIPQQMSEAVGDNDIIEDGDEYA